MTNVVAHVERVIASGVLHSSLTEFPPGASTEQVEAAQRRLGLVLPSDLRSLLQRWNGANLDVIRLKSCDGLRTEPGGLAFASDPAGFRYVAGASGEVVAIDSKSGSRKVVAHSVSSFLVEFVFGSGAVHFAGADWASELKRAGLAI